MNTISSASRADAAYQQLQQALGQAALAGDVYLTSLQQPSEAVGAALEAISIALGCPITACRLNFPGEPVVFHHYSGVLQDLDAATRAAGRLEAAARALNQPPAAGEKRVDHFPSRLIAVRDYDGETFLCLPLCTRQYAFGLVYVERDGSRPVSSDDLAILSVLTGQLALALINVRLASQLRTAMMDTIQVLAAAIDAKDAYTHGHSQSVARLAWALARHLGMPAHEVEDVYLAALLHDVGKIGIPDAVLNKPGKLEPGEYQIIQQHPAIGAQILSSIENLRPLVPAVRGHHERWDGNGYPDRLRGNAIPLHARLIAVCDVWDALTSDRIYRQAMSIAEARAIMVAGKGTQFDPALVDAFLQMVDTTSTT